LGYCFIFIKNQKQRGFIMKKMLLVTFLSMGLITAGVNATGKLDLDVMLVGDLVKVVVKDSDANLEDSKITEQVMAAAREAIPFNEGRKLFVSQVDENGQTVSKAIPGLSLQYISKGSRCESAVATCDAYAVCRGPKDAAAKVAGIAGAGYAKAAGATGRAYGKAAGIAGAGYEKAAEVAVAGWEKAQKFKTEHPNWTVAAGGVAGALIGVAAIVIAKIKESRRQSHYYNYYSFCGNCGNSYYDIHTDSCSRCGYQL
jgi:hypothetical protein